MEDLLKFVKFTTDFRGVVRTLALAREGRNENDAEHACQLALVAWYLVSTQKLNLDMGKVLQYALAHDLIEVYAGDTPAVIKGYSAQRETKHEREEKAIKQFKEEYPEFADIHEIISQYESRQDEEARFVYALDKIIPMMNIYLDQGYSWKKHEVTLQDLLDNKADKVKVSEEVKRYYDHLVERLRAEETWLFNTNR